MDTDTNKYPIHPTYKKACQEHRKLLDSMNSKIGTNTNPDILQKVIAELRSEADEYASKFIFPETLRSRVDICGGPNNVKVVTTIFRPIGSEKKVLPVIVFCHGGGWLLGSVITHGKLAADLCIKTQAAVMFVEYSLSPEFKFPVANAEVYASLCWIRESGKSVGLNPDRIAIAGDSAGGNMATVVSMMAKDRGMRDMIKAQILMYPILTTDTNTYPSAKKYGSGDCFLSLKDVDLAISAYVPPGMDKKNNTYIVPMVATLHQLKGLPPALVLTCECDVLRDEGEAYVSKLISAGVYTVGMRVLGSIHAYMSMNVPETPQYRSSMNMIVDFFKGQVIND